MPETKNNRRVRFTRSALREALIDLILEKPLVSITVKDICTSVRQTPSGRAASWNWTRDGWNSTRPLPPAGC